MGSLMAGWASDPEQVSHRRNKSLTREEIEAFWKTKKQLEEEHLKAILRDPLESSDEIKKVEFGGNLQRSNSVPPLNTNKSFMAMESEADLEEKPKKNGWWRRSNWAFLNEPPVTEGSGNRYVSQFHVANVAASKFGRGGVSAA
ncbi:uncharacterized protein LOC111018241 [Momordica charantia]|uniref:Uncharacterized protein LOC111018241 n=1 Tax=Momordica charantia TaxID=3673 RepID=A0A6J1DA26_MOMCH|nr:uncharacterized protein LOC111018241 [Momordica charantia]